LVPVAGLYKFNELGFAGNGSGGLRVIDGCPQRRPSSGPAIENRAIESPAIESPAIEHRAVEPSIAS